MRTDLTFKILLAAKSLVAALALGLVMMAATPASAQQVNSFRPTDSAVKEETLLKALKGPNQEINGRVSIPDGRAATLIRPAGQEWRAFNQGTLHTIGAIALLGMLALLVVFYLTRGKIKIDAGPSGQTITRFNSFERFMHWLTACSFIALALSGINATFGKSLLLPLIGNDAFSTLSSCGKYVHNYLAFPFMAGLILMLLTWIKDNIPAGADISWLLAGGGLLGRGHPPAKRFNAGQKLIFWSVILGGAALSVSGIHMLFPNLVGSILELQFWNVVHGVVAMVLIAIMLAHAYIGSIGMEGAFEAMGSGEVDLNWAKEHHSLWVAEELANGIKPVRGMQPAE